MIYRVVLVAFLLAKNALASPIDPTDHFLSYLSELLEQKIIDDEELLRLIADSESARIRNPIGEDEAGLSMAKQAAYITCSELLHSSIDSQSVLAWVYERLKNQEQARRQRQEVEDDTKFPWQVKKKIAAGFWHTCAVKADGTLACWGNNDLAKVKCLQTLGRFKKLQLRVCAPCAMKADSTLVCWGDKSFGQGEVPSDLGPIQSLGGKQ